MYRVGQRIVVMANGEAFLHNFTIGESVIITQIDDDSTQNIKATNSDGLDQWLDITQIRHDFSTYLNEIER